MAARLRKTHQEDVRRKIQATQLINLLQDNANGKLKEELSSGRIKSAEILLNKSVASLSNVEHTGDPDKPVAQRIEMVIIDAP